MLYKANLTLANNAKFLHLVMAIKLTLLHDAHVQVYIALKQG